VLACRIGMASVCSVLATVRVPAVPCTETKVAAATRLNKSTHIQSQFTSFLCFFWHLLSSYSSSFRPFLISFLLLGRFQFLSIFFINFISILLSSGLSCFHFFSGLYSSVFFLSLFLSSFFLSSFASLFIFFLSFRPFFISFLLLGPF
jgi:hypothetical protein